MERTSYLTEDEVEAVQVLHKRAPYALCKVSNGFFSISIHYGGLIFKGFRYTYINGHDECVRDDALKLVTKLRRTKSVKAAPAHEQLSLVDDIP